MPPEDLCEAGITTNVGFSVYELATGRRTVEINNRAPRRGTILLDSGRIVAAEMQRLVCYDVASGKTEWSVACQAASLNNPRFEGTVTVDGKACLLVPTVDRRVMCVDTRERASALDAGRRGQRRPDRRSRRPRATRPSSSRR